MWQRIGVIALVSVSLTACSNSTFTAQSTPVPPGASTGNVLRRSEIKDAGVRDVYEAVQRFRPLYLNRVRDMSSVNRGQSLVTVYMNDSFLGGIDMLRTVPIDAVTSIQYLSAAEATNRWGPKQPGAVIFISTR